MKTKPVVYLKCTKKVRDFCGIQSEEVLASEPTLLGDWYVNMFTVDRKKTLIFMNEQTLLSFICFGLKKSNCSDLGLILRRGIEQLLTMEAISVSQIDMLLKEYISLGYANTDSRSALGNMNDLTYLYKHAILDNGGFESCNLNEIIRQMNRMPQRKLGWKDSVSSLQEKLDRKKIGILM